MRISLAKSRQCIILALAALAGTLCVSCSQAKPEIRSKDVKVLRVAGPDGAFAERLSIFMLYEDSDGPADFSSMTVTHLESGLSWSVGADRASIGIRERDRWIGSNVIAGPAGGPILPGKYSIVATDLAGNEATSEFTLVRPNFPERAPCAFSISGEGWSIERNPDSGGFTRIWILLYDRDGKLLNTWKVPESGQKTITGFIKTLESVAPGAVSARCYVENASGNAGVLLTMVNMR